MSHLFPLEAVPLVIGASFSCKISEKPWRMRNLPNEMNSKFAGLSTPSSRKEIWMEAEWAEWHIYPKICPVSGSPDPHCLWSLLSRPGTHAFRNQRTAKLTPSFIRWTAWGLERGRHSSGPLAWVVADFLLTHRATPGPTSPRDYSEGLKLEHPDVSTVGTAGCFASMAETTSFASRHSRKPAGLSLHSDTGDLGHAPL